MGLLSSYSYVLGSLAGVGDTLLSVVSTGREHTGMTPPSSPEFWVLEGEQRASILRVLKENRVGLHCTHVMKERPRAWLPDTPVCLLKQGSHLCKVDVVLANCSSFSMFTLCRKLVEEKYEENNKRMQELRSRNFQQLAVDVLHVSVLLFSILQKTFSCLRFFRFTGPVG